MSSELVASVQSLVAVLQQQIDTSSHQDVTDTDAIVRGPQETRLMHHLPDNNVSKNASSPDDFLVFTCNTVHDTKLTQHLRLAH